MNRPVTPRMPSIHLNIGSLALPGYTQANGQRLAGAFKRELGRLLAQGQPPERGYQVERLQIPRFRLTAADRPEQVGRRLARLIAEQLRS